MLCIAYGRACSGIQIIFCHEFSGSVLSAAYITSLLADSLAAPCNQLMQYFINPIFRHFLACAFCSTSAHLPLLWRHSFVFCWVTNFPVVHLLSDCLPVTCARVSWHQHSSLLRRTQHWANTACPAPCLCFSYTLCTTLLCLMEWLVKETTRRSEVHVVSEMRHFFSNHIMFSSNISIPLEALESSLSSISKYMDVPAVPASASIT